VDIWVRASRLSRVVVATLTLLVLGTLVPPPAEAAVASVVYHGSRHRPYIALTIDDGYNSANCRLANILRASNVPATYFPYAGVFNGAPATWRYISSWGFRIGNHTVSHPFMTRLTYSSQLQQITRAQRILRNVTGQTMLPLFRPPYGSYNLDTRRAAGAAGIKYLVLWDTTFADTATMSDAAHFRHAMGGTKGSIILLHCGPASSVRILPRVIAAYRARGLQFVTVEKLLGLTPTPTPTPTPEPSPSSSSTSAAIDGSTALRKEEDTASSVDHDPPDAALPSGSESWEPSS
jgi:peptidoglycan/xylan/chitin deacetylase (PgdA/CDA1 family)